MIDGSWLFITYSPVIGNLEVRIANDSLSFIVRKWSIRLSNPITLYFVVHVYNLSCNLISISQLTKTFPRTANFFRLSSRTYH